jgi:hypothetical protein
LGAIGSGEDGLKPGWIKGEIIFARALNLALDHHFLFLLPAESLQRYYSISA